MLNKATAQLVEEVLGHFGEDDRKEAQRDPEACLVSMLTLIKKRLSVVSATLDQTIELTTSDKYLQEARRKLEEAKAEEIKS